MRKYSEKKKEIQETVMTSQEEKDQRVSRKIGRWSRSPHSSQWNSAPQRAFLVDLQGCRYGPRGEEPGLLGAESKSNTRVEKR